jgi:hypothetical protein
MAQVYSVNAVGYINITIPANGLDIVANQLNTGGNTLDEVLPNPTDGTIIYTFSAATGYSIAIADFGWGAAGTTVINPGKAFFVRAPSTGPVTLTFVGEVPQGALSTPLVNGLNLVASQVPQAGALSGALGYTAAEGDTVYQWTGTGYSSANIFDFGAWGAGDPNLEVGEGFWLIKNAAGNWTRNFSVNQ